MQLRKAAAAGTVVVLLALAPFGYAYLKDDSPSPEPAVEEEERGFFDPDLLEQLSKAAPIPQIKQTLVPERGVTALRPLVAELNKRWAAYFQQINRPLVTAEGANATDLALVDLASPVEELSAFCGLDTTKAEEELRRGFGVYCATSPLLLTGSPLATLAPTTPLQTVQPGPGGHIVLPAAVSTSLNALVAGLSAPQAQTYAALLVAYYYGLHLEHRLQKAGLANWAHDSELQWCLTGVGLRALVAGFRQQPRPTLDDLFRFLDTIIRRVPLVAQSSVLLGYNDGKLTGCMLAR